MRKFLAVIFVFGFIFSVVPLLLLTNIKITVLSPEKIKTLMSESNIYDFLAGGLRESIVKTANTGVENGQFLEIINEALDNATLIKVAENSIDQFFLIANKKDAEPRITIKMSLVEDRIRQVVSEKKYGGDIKLLGNDGRVTSTLADAPFGGDQVYLINQFPFAGSLIRFSEGLLISAISTIVLLLIIFFISSNSNDARFKWLSGAFFLLGLVLSGLIYLNFLFIPANISYIVNQFSLRDPRFISGATKFVTNLNSTQKIPLIIETALSFIIGIVFIVIGSTFRRETIEVGTKKGVKKNNS